MYFYLDPFVPDPGCDDVLPKFRSRKKTGVSGCCREFAPDGFLDFFMAALVVLH